MDLDAVLAALRTTGAAVNDDPATLAVALAAAGALATRDADPQRPPPLHAPLRTLRPAIATGYWQGPTSWLTRVGSAADIAVDCWDASSASDLQPPGGGVRLVVSGVATLDDLPPRAIALPSGRRQDFGSGRERLARRHRAGLDVAAAAGHGHRLAERAAAREGAAPGELVVGPRRAGPVDGTVGGRQPRPARRHHRVSDAPAPLGARPRIGRAHHERTPVHRSTYCPGACFGSLHQGS